MGNSNTVNVVTLLIAISVYGLVWGQHLSCPAQDWTLGSTITLRCYLPGEDYPSKCTERFIDRVTFKRRSFTGSGSDRCRVNNVNTTSCTPSSSECGCQPANATHFIVHHTFTVDADDDGTWQCTVVCLNDIFQPVLMYTSDHCDNRSVVAYAVLSTPTITVITPDTGSGWTVRGTVDITRIFSSTGHYSCMWSYRRNSGQYTDITNSTITIDNSTAVWTGQCGFPDRPLSSDPGTYTYRVTVSPGQTVKTDSSVVIEPPVISSSNCNPSTVLENEEVTCTCEANVGQPAGRLRWLMESTTGTTAIEDGQYGDGTLTVRQTVDRNHHGNTLRCEVDWITDITGPDFTLQVAYPPSSPVISLTDGQSYPPLEGDTVTLNCSLTSPGYPSARITWPSEGPAVNTNPLQLSVDRGDNQRDVTCQASNEFTQQKGLEVTDDFTLQVYYEPDITLSPAAGNECTMTSDRMSCSVVEGERVHLQCNVHSNPDPKDCIWNAPSGSDIDLDSGPDLDIVSVNMNHSGVYQVQVETTKPDNSDGRLPLRAHRNLIILVKSSSVHPEEESSVNTEAIALGITLAVVIAIVLVVIIWVWRLGWILPCASDSRRQVGQKTRERKELNTERPPLESAAPPVSEDYELTEDGSRRHAGGELQSPSPYSSLQTSDIGVPSVYSQISQHSDTEFAVHQGPVYENSWGQEQA